MKEVRKQLAESLKDRAGPTPDRSDMIPISTRYAGPPAALGCDLLVCRTGSLASLHYSEL